MLHETPPLRIVVDIYEEPSRVPDRLRALGVDVELRVLRAGDYLVGDSVMAERKEVLDLHSAVIRGRFWHQLGALRARGKRAYLIVEGATIDAGPLPPASVRGVLVAVIESDIRLVQTRDQDDTALWLYSIAVRTVRARPRHRPAYSQRPKAPPELAPEAMLSAVPGISVATARLLLRRFGSIAAIAEATPAEWQTVRGIGQRRATALGEALGVDLTHAHRGSRSRQRRERQDLST